MIRLLSPPGIVTGLVVMLSLAGGVAFGASLAGVVLAVGSAARPAHVIAPMHLPASAALDFGAGTALGGMAVLSAEALRDLTGKL